MNDEITINGFTWRGDEVAGVSLLHNGKVVHTRKIDELEKLEKELNEYKEMIGLLNLHSYAPEFVHDYFKKLQKENNELKDIIKKVGFQVIAPTCDTNKLNMIFDTINDALNKFEKDETING